MKEQKYRVDLKVKTGSGPVKDTALVTATSVFDAKVAAMRVMYGRYMPGADKYMKATKVS